MQTTARRSPFAPLADAFANASSAVTGFFHGLLIAKWATQDLARYHAMSDAELAQHDMTREDIADKVVNRYLK